MRRKEELKEIYNGMNESEKIGLLFGLFPARLKDLTKDESVELMKIAMEAKGEPWGWAE